MCDLGEKTESFRYVGVGDVMNFENAHGVYRLGLFIGRNLLRSHPRRLDDEASFHRIWVHLNIFQGMSPLL